MIAQDPVRGGGHGLDVQRVGAPADPGPAGDEDQQRGDRKVTAWQSWMISLQELHIAAGAPTVRKIAQACVRPVSHSTISDLLRGDRLPSWPVARTLIEALGADDRRRAEMFGLWTAAQVEARAGRTDWSMPPPATLGPAVEDAMLNELIMIRKLLEQLVEGRATEVVAASSVVAGSGLMLAAAPPDRPVDRGLDTACREEDEGGEQAADLVG